MFKKARFVLNLLQNYKKIGENLQLFREILYFCIKISNILHSDYYIIRKGLFREYFSWWFMMDLEREKWRKN